MLKASSVRFPSIRRGKGLKRKAEKTNSRFLLFYLLVLETSVSYVFQASYLCGLAIIVIEMKESQESPTFTSQDTDPSSGNPAQPNPT